jgi:hypothetical protein
MSNEMLQQKFTYEQHHTFCFHRPCPPNELPTELHTPELRPVLHLLRRDLELLYGLEEEEYCPGGMKPGFITLLGMLTGLDMLASMYCGEGPMDEKHKSAQDLLDKNGFDSIRLHQSGRKNIRFLTEVAGLTKQEAAFLWTVRNSLAHTYSLNTSEKAYRNNSVTTAKPAGKLIDIGEDANSKKYVLNLWELKKVFLKSVENLRKLLETAEMSSDVRKRFCGHVQSSGYIKIEK